MKVVLMQDLEGQGQRGDVKDVRNGYARNYLIPHGIAAEATKENLGRLEQEKQHLESRRKKKLAQAEEIKRKLEKGSVTISAKAGQDDKLFGAITSEDIAGAVLEQAGVEIDRHQIVLDQPFKKLGIYKLSVRLTENVEGELKIWVVREK